LTEKGDSSLAYILDATCHYTRRVSPLDAQRSAPSTIEQKRYIGREFAMSDDEKANKKRRLDLVSLAPPVVQSDLWFDDGNIIIQAEHLQFRVHQGMLSRSSPKFKEAFLTLTKKNDDGVPIVLIPEQPEALGHLLNALYDR
jgi:hypothetical protein